MKEFPAFMRDRRNAIPSHQQSAGVTGFVFDGADGSQVALFACAMDGISKEHAHDFEEYIAVVQGEYVLGVGGNRITLTRGDEYCIPRGTFHDGAFTAGTRTIHAFGGHRADREES